MPSIDCSSGTVQVDEHGTVRGVAAMKAGIAARGPIACLMYAHAEDFEQYEGGIIRDETRYHGITHVVTVVGWGVAAGEEFWVVRMNSFGTAWGEYGYYRQVVGKDVYNMESHDFVPGRRQRARACACSCRAAGCRPLSLEPSAA